MTTDTCVWDDVGALFRYPGADYVARARRCQQMLTATAPGPADRLGRFVADTGGLSTEALQELFTATFDFNPACAPEVGWHLFGENYERGAFLVEMRDLLTRFDLLESGELPDHLAPVLGLVGRMPEEEAQAFVRAALLPALRKMQASLAGKANPFEHVLEAVARLAEHQFAALSRIADRRDG